ncbi:MAG: hypothetical protein ABSC49_01885 [Candidatus Microgenomates bacterium]|jgi:hypothetical protein
MRVPEFWREKDHYLNPTANGFLPERPKLELKQKESVHIPGEEIHIESGIIVYQATQDQILTVAVLVKRQQQADAEKLTSLSEELRKLPSSPDNQVIH